MDIHPATIGSIISFYSNSDYCEVEICDAEGDPVGVVTYETKELELF